MIVQRLQVKSVVTPIVRGNIHGQGGAKRYVYLILTTSEGISCSEIYSGTYNLKIISEIVHQISDRLVGSKVSLQDIHLNFLHVPFISGAGIYQSVITGIYNCFVFQYMESLLNEFSEEGHLHCYLSGGTVKTGIDDLEYEIDYCYKNSFKVYKVRLDFRDLNQSLEKIKILNDIKFQYAIDFIINTNHLCDDIHRNVNILLDAVDPAKISWIEEPFFPTTPLTWDHTFQVARKNGLKIALGESLTSLLELNYVAQDPRIDILQLDATHNSDLLSLNLLKQHAIECKKEIGFHNWGSKIGLLMNSILAKNIVSSYFEVPYYATHFDEKINRSLGHSADPLEKSNTDILRNLHDIQKNLSNLILSEPDLSHSDFEWS